MGTRVELEGRRQNFRNVGRKIEIMGGRAMERVVDRREGKGNEEETRKIM